MLRDGKRGFCLYNQDGSILRVVEDDTEMQQIFSKVLKAFDEKQRELYGEDATQKNGKSSNNPYSTPAERANNARAAASGVVLRATMDGTSSKNEPDIVGGGRSTRSSRRSAGRSDGNRSSADEGLVSLTYSYGTMDWDAIEMCWKPKKKRRRKSNKQKTPPSSSAKTEPHDVPPPSPPPDETKKNDDVAPPPASGEPSPPNSVDTEENDCGDGDEADGMTGPRSISMDHGKSPGEIGEQEEAILEAIEGSPERGRMGGITNESATDLQSADGRKEGDVEGTEGMDGNEDHDQGMMIMPVSNKNDDGGGEQKTGATNNSLAEEAPLEDAAIAPRGDFVNDGAENGAYFSDTAPQTTTIPAIGGESLADARSMCSMLAAAWCGKANSSKKASKNTTNNDDGPEGSGSSGTPIVIDAEPKTTTTNTQKAPKNTTNTADGPESSGSPDTPIVIDAEPQTTTNSQKASKDTTNNADADGPEGSGSSGTPIVIS